MSHIGHGITKCFDCQKVMERCRCMSANGQINWSRCDECQKKLSGGTVVETIFGCTKVNDSTGEQAIGVKPIAPAEFVQVTLPVTLHTALPESGDAHEVSYSGYEPQKFMVISPKPVEHSTRVNGWRMNLQQLDLARGFCASAECGPLDMLELDTAMLPSERQRIQDLLSALPPGSCSVTGVAFSNGDPSADRAAFQAWQNGIYNARRRAEHARQLAAAYAEAARLLDVAAEQLDVVHNLIAMCQPSGDGEL